MKKNLLVLIDTTIENPVVINKHICVGDTLRIVIKIFNNGVAVDLTNETVDVCMVKSDSTTVESGGLSSSTNEIIFDAGPQATTCPGTVTGEIKIGDSSGNQLTTNTFTFIVSNTTTDVVIPGSVNDIRTLIDLANLIVKVNNATDLFKDNMQAIGGTAEATEALTNIKQYIDDNLGLLESKNTSAISNISSLQDENTRAETNIQSLEGFGDITGLTDSVTKLESEIQVARGSFTSLNDRLDNITTTVNNALIYDANEDNKTYYVDNINGLDTNNGLTEATAFNTLEKAWSMIPLYFNKVYNIVILNSYNADATLSTKFGTAYNSQVIIRGLSDTTKPQISGRVYITGVQVSSSQSSGSNIYPGIWFKNIDFVDNGAIRIYNCKDLYISNCSFDKSTIFNTNAIIIFSSYVAITSCTFKGLSTSSVGMIYSYRFANILGSNNTFTNTKNVYTIYNMTNCYSSKDTFTNCTNQNVKDTTSTFNITTS